MLDRDAILAAPNPVAPVAIPEWGEQAVVYVRHLSGLEADQLQTRQQEPNFLGWFAAMVIANQSGQRLFSEEDAEALGRKSQVILLRICNAAQDHNGMTTKAQEETEKNSETIRADSSGSTSPES